MCVFYFYLQFAWSCIHFGFDIVHIYASRMFGGVAAGGAFVVLPIFINEIAESREKAARLTFTIELWRTLGILFGIALGFFAPYDYTNIVGCIASCTFTLCFPFVQESPHYYLRRGNLQCLEKSLRWYRGIRDIDDRENPEYQHELADFKAEMKGEGKSFGTSPLTHGYVVRLICVSFLLTVCAKLSGVFVELNYAADFLGRTGYSMQMNYMLLAGAQCVGALFARLFGPHLPRKVRVCVPQCSNTYLYFPDFIVPIINAILHMSINLLQLLLCLSSLLAAVAVIALALFKEFGPNWAFGDWLSRYLPIILLAAQLLFVSFGLYPLAAVVSSEVLPTKVSRFMYLYHVLYFKHGLGECTCGEKVKSERELCRTV